MQDQDIIDIKCPIPIDEPVDILKDDVRFNQNAQPDNALSRYFPTSAMYNRQSNF